MLILEDDIRIASSFALRLMSWITAIEARHSCGRLIADLQPTSNAGLFSARSVLAPDPRHNGTPAQHLCWRPLTSVKFSCLLHYRHALKASRGRSASWGCRVSARIMLLYQHHDLCPSS